MLRIVLSIAVACVLCGVDVRAQNAAQSACDAPQLQTSPSASAGGTLLERLITSMMGTFERSRSEQKSANDLEFTTRSDFSLVPDCVEPGSLKWNNGLYYPIGLVVRRLSEIKTASRVLALVEAEHGMHMYIPEEDLAPVEDGKTYIFANSHLLKPYCIGHPKCDGPDPEKPNQNLSAQRLYAIAISQPEPGLEGDSCASFRVDLYGKSAVKVDIGQSNQAYVDTCLFDSRDNQRKLDGRIKVVVADKYKKLFSIPLDGSYQRFSGTLLSRIIPNTLTYKACNETSVSRTHVKGTISVGVEYDYYFVNAKASGELGTEKAWTSEEGSDKYIFYSYYYLHRRNLNNGYTVAAISLCDEHKAYPDKPYYLSLTNEAFGSGEISVVYSHLKETYRMIVPEFRGLNDTPTQEMYSRGQFWTISGSDQYFIMRDALKAYVFDMDEAITELAPSDAPTDLERERTRDFIAHLILAAASRFKPVPNR